MIRTAVVVSSLLACGAALAADAPAYTKVKDIALPDRPAAFDAVTIEPISRRLFVAHATQVEVVDVDKGERIGFVKEVEGARMAIAVPAVKKGFATAGKSDKLVVFDLAPPETPAGPFKNIKSDVEVGHVPDALLYVQSTKELWVVNHGDSTITVVDPDKVAFKATIAALGGKLNGAVEWAAKGLVYVCAEDKDLVYVIDTKKHAGVTRRSVEPSAGPRGIALDEKDALLYVSCEGKLVVIDALKSNVVVALPIGERCDAVAYDASKGLIFAPSAAGTTTVIKKTDAKTFAVVGTIETAAGGHTCAIDPKTHALWVPVGTKRPEPSKDEGAGAPEWKPDHHILQFAAP